MNNIAHVDDQLTSEENEIQILTGLNPVNIEYFYYLVDNFRNMSSGKTKLNFKIVVGPARGRRDVVCSAHQMNLIRSKGAEVIDGNHLPGIGETLNFFMNELGIKKNSYTLIVDIDVAMVSKNWDLKAIELLENYDVIGFPFEESSALKNGKSPSNAIRYQKNPSIVWMMFRFNDFWKNLDFRHSKDEEHAISDKDSSLYGIPEGYFLAKDIGWRAPQFFDSHNLKSYSITNINKHSDLQPILFSGIPLDMPWGDGTGKSGWPCEEGTIEGVPFLAHQRLSQRWGFKESNISRTFYDLVDKYLSAFQRQK